MLLPTLPFLLFTLLLALPLTAWAQLISTAAPPSFTATTILSVPEESLYTNTIQAVSTFRVLETIAGTPTAVVTTEYYFNGIQATDVAVVPGYIINNVDAENYALCWYPTSGNWARMPRVIFYGTIVFALLAREHEWLVAGALAASLTFSGVAAVQLSLQVWTQQMAGELDFFALLGILSTSCIIAVPLLNWSSTIRYLGQSEEARKAREQRDRQMRHRQQQLRNTTIEVQAAQAEEAHAEDRKHENYGPTRTVIVFWAVLVSVGFLAGFVGLIWLRYQTTNNDGITLLPYSGVSSIRCVPDNGILNLTAGQFEHWPQFYMTSEFIAENHCENPCTALQDGSWTLFRSPDTDLATLTARQLDNVIWNSATSARETRNLEFVDFYFSYMVFGLPFILAQGFFQFLLFRKHSPQDARQKIYLWIAGSKSSTAHPLRRGFALAMAVLFYFFAVVTLLLTPVILVTNVVATEFFMYIFPQNEDNKHVGQWSVPAGTLLVLIAAFLCRFDAGATRIVRATSRAVRKTASRWRRKITGRRREVYRVQPEAEADRPALFHKDSFQPRKAFFGIFVDSLRSVQDSMLDTCDSLWWYMKDFGGLFSHEWMLFVLFWQNPGFIRPEALVYRDRPPRPERRRQRKTGGDHTAVPRGDTAPRYDLVEEHPLKDLPGARITTYSFGDGSQPVQSTDAERPLLSYANSTASIVPLPSAARSQALSVNNAQSLSAAQSPRPFSPTQQNSHFYTAVPGGPSHQTSPSLTLIQENTLYDAPHITQSNPVSVLNSLTNSIAARSRRSDVYSPEPGQQYQPPPPPQPHSHLSPIHSRTSNLFSESELAALYSSGTPNVRSTQPSRDSLTTSSATSSAANAAHVSYLQIQSPINTADTDSWGDQLTLRRDRQGRWVIMDPRAQSTRETIHENAEVDEAGDQTPPTRPREW